MSDHNAAGRAMTFLADGLAHEHDLEEIARFVMEDRVAAGACLDLAITALRQQLLDCETIDGTEALAVYVQALRFRGITAFL